MGYGPVGRIAIRLVERPFTITTQTRGTRHPRDAGGIKGSGTFNRSKANHFDLPRAENQDNIKNKGTGHL